MISDFDPIFLVNMTRRAWLSGLGCKKRKREGKAPGQCDEEDTISINLTGNWLLSIRSTLSQASKLSTNERFTHSQQSNGKRILLMSNVQSYK